MSDNKLSKVFGIDPIELQKAEPREKAEIPEDATDIDKDYILARHTLKGLIDTGVQAIDNASFLAKDLETPRGYEVLGRLITAVSQTAKDLLELQQKTKELKSEKNRGGDVHVDKAVFVGSTADLLRKIKAEKNGSV
jgi:Terminase DNA packaging enzyme